MLSRYPFSGAYTKSAANSQFAVVVLFALMVSVVDASDLSTPSVVDAKPAAGKRVKLQIEPYKTTNIYHAFYLPKEWNRGRKYPVIFEYPGNQYKTGPGTVDACNLGYGITGGQGAIWVCLPFVDLELGEHAVRWWGDVEATVAYCKAAVDQVCDEYGGDRDRLFLAGFSRGSIACNFIGLHDDEIAKLWRGFICHSHYDGVKLWPYPESDRVSAAKRLKRLGQRPQFISQEKSTSATQDYLRQAAPLGKFTFVDMPDIDHTDSWVLEDSPAREKIRDWFQSHAE